MSKSRSAARRVLAFLLSFLMASSSISTPSLAYAQEMLALQEDVQVDEAPLEQQGANDAQAVEQSDDAADDVELEVAEDEADVQQLEAAIEGQGIEESDIPASRTSPVLGEDGMAVCGDPEEASFVDWPTIPDALYQSDNTVAAYTQATKPNQISINGTVEDINWSDSNVHATWTVTEAGASDPTTPVDFMIASVDSQERVFFQTQARDNTYKVWLTITDDNNGFSHSEAQEVSCVKAVAAVVSGQRTLFATFDDAFDFALEKNNATIELCENIPDEGALTTSYEVGTNKNITLNLNGHTITAEPPAEATGDWSFFNVTEGGQLTVSGPYSGVVGSIDVTGTDAHVFNVDGTDSTLSVTPNTRAFAQDDSCVVVDNNANVYVSGGTVHSKSGYAIVGQGSIQPYNNIVVRFGEVTSTDGTAIYSPTGGVVTIQGGTISGGKSGIEMRAGTLNMSGGTVMSTSTLTPTSEESATDATTTGAGIAVALIDNAHNVRVSVIDGIVEGPAAVYESNPNGVAPQGFCGNASISLSGGTFQTPDAEIAGKSAVITKGLDENLRRFISGGYYSDRSEETRKAEPTNKVLRLIASGEHAGYYELAASVTLTFKASADDENPYTDKFPVGEALTYAPVKEGYSLAGWHEVIGGNPSEETRDADFAPTADDNNKTFVAEWAEAAVASITAGEVTTNYSTVQEAISNAEDGQTVKLLASLSTTQVEMRTAKSITLDLNGNALSGRLSFYDGVVTIANGTLKGRLDVCEASAVTIADDATVDGTVVVLGDGAYGQEGCKTPTLNVNGEVKRSADAFNDLQDMEGDEATYAIITTNDDDESKPVINVTEGAKVDGGEDQVGVNLPSGVLNISGGEIIGSTAVFFKSTDLAITGGTLTGKGQAAEYNGGATGEALIIDGCNSSNGAGSVSVSGGTFVSEQAENAVGSYNSQGGVLQTKFVSGGSFSSIVPDELCVDGKASTTVPEDGKYTVTDAWTVTYKKGADDEDAYYVDKVAKGEEIPESALPEDPTADKWFFEEWMLCKQTSYGSTQFNDIAFPFAVTEDTLIVAAWDPAAASITNGTGEQEVTTYYKTLQEAVDVAGRNGNSETVQLVRTTFSYGSPYGDFGSVVDERISSTKTLQVDHDVTLDINGCWLDSKSENGVINVTAGTLTLDDTPFVYTYENPMTQEEMTFVAYQGMIRSTDGLEVGLGDAITVASGAHLIVEHAGAIHGKSGIANSGTVTVSDAGIVGEQSGILNYDGGVVTINGGLVRSEVISILNSGTLTMMGGEVGNRPAETEPGLTPVFPDDPEANADTSIGIKNTTTGTVTIDRTRGAEPIIRGGSKSVVNESTAANSFRINGGYFSDDEGNGLSFTRKNNRTLTKVENAEESSLNGLFTLAPIVIDSVAIANEPIYNGVAQEPELVVKAGTVEVPATSQDGDEDVENYTVTYAPKQGDVNAKLDEDDKPVNAGTYVVTIGQVQDSDYVVPEDLTAEFTIAPKSIRDASVNATIPSQTYTGSAITDVEPKIVDDDILDADEKSTALTKDTDYELGDFENNTDPGTATLVVTGKGNYTDRRTTNFQIVRDADAIGEATITLSPETCTYNGLAQTPAVTVKKGDKTLVKDTDYSVTYYNNIDAGNALAYIEGKGGYVGSTVKEFKINKANITATTTLEGWTYGEDANTPVTKVKLGDEEMSDFPQEAITYAYAAKPETGAPTDDSFDAKVPTNAGAYVVRATIAATANYNAAMTTAVFTVAKKSITAKVDDVTKVYGDPDPEFTVTFTGLVGNDTIGYTVSRQDTEERVKDYEINADITPNPNYELEEVEPGTLTIVPRDISSAVIAPIENQLYKGEPIEPVLKVTLGVEQLPPTAYETIYDNNTDVGLATVFIHGNGDGNYTGSASAQFAINKKDSAVVAMAVDPATYTYTGEAVVPIGVTVYDTKSDRQAPLDGFFKPEGSERYYKIIPPESYDLTFYNNVNAGTATAIATLKGNYEGITTTTFTIEKASVTRPTVTESFDYDGNEKTAVETPAADASYRIIGTSKATDAGSYTVTAALKDTNNYQWAETSSDANDATSSDLVYNWTIAPKAAGFSVDDIADQTYTGSPIKPAVTVKDGDKTLAEGTDYTVAYDANTAIGTGTATVTGKGNYAGTKVAEFNIVPKGEVAAPLAKDDLVYNGQTQTGVEAGEGYTLSGIVEATGAGDYTAVATLADGYVWADGVAAETDDTVKVAWSIAKKPVVVNGGYAETVYGLAPTQGPVDVEGLVGDDELVYGDDYEVTYQKQGTSPGTAIDWSVGRYSIIVTIPESAKNNENYDVTRGYPGMIAVTPRDFANADIETIPSQTYTGAEIAPDSVVTYPMYGQPTLQKGTDYTISYENNTDVGIAKATFAGRGNYRGEQTVYFAINKADNKSLSVSDIADQVYTGEAITPPVTVTDDKGTNDEGDDVELVKDKDYDVSYASNVEPGTATVVITLKGNYEGALTQTFRIVKGVTEVALPSAASDLVYNGQTQTGVEAGEGYTVADGTATDAGDYTATLTLGEGYKWPEQLPEGATLNEGDGTVEVAWSIAKATPEVAVALADWTYGDAAKLPILSVRLDGKLVAAEDYAANYSYAKADGTAVNGVPTDAGDYVVTATVSGKNLDETTATDDFKISPKQLPASQPVVEQTYTGSAITPAVIVMDGDKKLVEGTDYDVASWLNNTKVGDAMAVLQGKGNYTGMQFAKFSIVENAAAKEVAVPTAVDGLVYDGAEQAGVSYDNAVPFTVTGEATAKDAGTHTATFTLPAGYVWAGVEGEAASAPRTVSWSIAKKPATIKVGSATIQFLKALVDFSAFTVDVEGEVGNDKLAYELTTTYRAGDPVTAPGEGYLVTADFDADAAPNKNYDITAEPGALHVYRLDVEPPTAATGLVYNGSEQDGVVPGSASYYYTLEGDAKATNAGNYTATAKLPNSRDYRWADSTNGDDRVIQWSIDPASISAAYIEPVGAQTYTGNAFTPEPTVTDGETTLAKGDDFTYSYDNNTDVGIATITVTGKGNYTGKATTQFAINEKGSAAAGMSIEGPGSRPYTGKEQKPGVTVKDGEKTLAAGTDYDLTYVNNKEVGTATIIATLKGNYEGSLTTTFPITENSKDALKDAIDAVDTMIVPTSEDGSDVPVGANKYVTPADQKALDEAVAAAKKVADDPNKTSDEIAAAKNDLNAAVGAYNNAKKTVRRYTVTFDAKGGEPAPAKQTVNQNATATEPATPSKSGYLFQGWTLDAKAYSFASKVTKDITLIAKWQAASGTNQQIASIDPIEDQQYKGDAVTPKVTVRDASGNVVDSSKYDVTYKDNAAPGTGMVLVSPKNNAHGSAAASFTIKDARTKVAKPGAKSFAYDAAAHTGVASAKGYALSGTAKATNAGTPPPTWRSAGRSRRLPSPR